MDWGSQLFRPPAPYIPPCWFKSRSFIAAGYLIAHQSTIHNYSCWLNPNCVEVFPVLDKQQLEVISSRVHFPA